MVELVQKEKHYWIKDRIEVNNESVNKSNSTKTDEEYCLRNTRRVLTDTNCSIMNASFHNDRNNDIDAQRRTANVIKITQYYRECLDYSVAPADKKRQREMTTILIIQNSREFYDLYRS